MTQPTRQGIVRPPARPPRRGFVLRTRGAQRSPQAGGVGVERAWPYGRRPGSYFNRIEICRPGFTDPIAFQAFGGEVEWTIDAPGRLSVIVPTAAVPRDDEWRGASIFFRDRLAGAWGGYVEDAPVGLGQATVELSCSSLAGRLAGARTPRAFGTQRAPAGSLAIRATSDADRAGVLPFRTLTADVGGAWLEQEWRADSVLSVWQNLARQANEHWVVSIDDDKVVTARWFRRFREMRHRVVLTEGYQFRGERIAPGSLSSIRNDLLVISDQGRLAEARAEVVLATSSIRRYDRWQTAERVVGNAATGTLLAIGRRRLETLSDPPTQIEVVLTARHHYNQLIREGDVIRVWSHAARKRYDFYVYSRHLSLGARTMTYRGDAWEADD